MQENIIIAGHHAHAQVSTSWQQQLSHAIRDPDTLCQRLGLDAQWLPEVQAGHRLFDICVPDAELAANGNDRHLARARTFDRDGARLFCCSGHMGGGDASARPRGQHRRASSVAIVACPHR